MRKLGILTLALVISGCSFDANISSSNLEIKARTYTIYQNGKEWHKITKQGFSDQWFWGVTPEGKQITFLGTFTAIEE